MFTSHHRRPAAVKRLRDLGARLLPELTLESFELERITLPVLLVWGDRDRMVSHEGARHVLAAVPDARYETLDGVGHCPQLEDPERFTELLTGSSTSVRAAPRSRSCALDDWSRRADRHGGRLRLDLHWRACRTRWPASSCPMDLIPSPERVSTAAANAFDMIFRGGVADLRRTPAQIISEAPKRVVYRYLPPHDEPQHDLPVLLVPPLAAPSVCFDLRRGCSLAEHLIAVGHPTYLVEYGAIALLRQRPRARVLGPRRAPERDPHASARTPAGARCSCVGWCLGGIMSLLALAGDESLPVASVALVASPFDFRQVRLMSPIRGRSRTSPTASSARRSTARSAARRRRSSSAPSS